MRVYCVLQNFFGNFFICFFFLFFLLLLFKMLLNIHKFALSGNSDVVDLLYVCWFFYFGCNFCNTWWCTMLHVQLTIYSFKLPNLLPTSRTWHDNKHGCRCSSVHIKSLQIVVIKIFFVMWLWSLWCVSLSHDKKHFVIICATHLMGRTTQQQN